MELLASLVFALAQADWKRRRGIRWSAARAERAQE